MYLKVESNKGELPYVKNRVTCDMDVINDDIDDDCGVTDIRAIRIDHFQFHSTTCFQSNYYLLETLQPADSLRPQE